MLEKSTTSAIKSANTENYNKWESNLIFFVNYNIFIYLFYNNKAEIWNYVPEKHFNGESWRCEIVTIFCFHPDFNSEQVF